MRAGHGLAAVLNGLHNKKCRAVQAGRHSFLRALRHAWTGQL